MSNLRARTLLIPLAAALALASCSSDEFSGVGGSLPTDVSQDSLEVPLGPVYPTAAVVITPLDTVAGPERPALYLGDRMAGGWRATPLLRFDVGDSVVQSKIPLDWTNVDVYLRLKAMNQSEDAAVVRRVTIYDLAAPLADDALLVDDASTLFGAAIDTATFTKTDNPVVALDKDVVRGWFDAGTHNGIAIWHESAVDPPADLYSTMSGYAGTGSIPGSRLNDGVPAGAPELFFDLRGAGDNFEVPVLLDLGHVQRDLPGPGDLQLGSYFERRIWFDFDIGPDIVPTDATVNSGTLVLQIRPDLTLQVRPFSEALGGPVIIDQEVRAWEALRDEAGDVAGVTTAWRRGNRLVLDSPTTFDPDPAGGDLAEDIADGELRIDVTEYVQRQVNEIGPTDLPGGATVDQVGLLVAFVSEKLDLDLGVFYGLDAPDDLKPRLEITYTPPSDTWR